MVALTGPSTAGKPPRRRTSWGTRVWRWAVLALIGGYLLLPLVSMADFSTRQSGGARTLEPWQAITTYPDLVGGIITSLELSVLSVLGVLVLLVPTMVWVHLRLPLLRRPLELLCLLPLTIPAIVLVVGMAPIYAWVTYLFGDSPLTLTFVYVVLALPYAYRAIDASLRSVDVTTLAEAARTLGASWPRTIVGVLVPNIRVGIASAAVISIALVLCEFTIASLLNFETLQVVINLLGKRDAQVSVAVSLAALLFAFVLLVVLPTGESRPRRPDDDPDPAPEGGLV
jgi:putative spermidine/putrescine transport system permease protein